MSNWNKITKKSGALSKQGVMDTKDVALGYEYWVTYFIDMSMDLFEWSGLPDTLPSDEIEKRLIRTGFCIIFEHPTEGIVTSNGSLYDYDFYGRYRKYNVVNPYRTFTLGKFLPTGKIIGDDGVVVYNTGTEKYLDMSTSDNLFFTTICRYARMMADIESTLSSELITQRMPFLPIASNQAGYESIKNVFSKMEQGKIEVAIDNDFLQDIKILKNKELVSNYLSELINNRRNILSMFYAEIGMYQPDNKRERLLVDEIENGQNNEKTLIYSLLRERQKGAEVISEFFDKKVEVNLRTVLYDTDVDIIDMEESEVN